MSATSSNSSKSSILSLFTSVHKRTQSKQQQKVFKEGWLFQKSSISTQYKKRWIVLKDTKLLCYSSENIEYYTNTDKIQTFNLSLYRFKVEKHCDSPCKFLLKNESVTNGSNEVIFKTLTEKDRNDWIFKLQEAIIACKLAKSRGIAPLYSTFESAIAQADNASDDSDSDKNDNDNDDTKTSNSSFDAFRIRSITISSTSRPHLNTYNENSDDETSEYIENNSNVIGIKIMTPQIDDKNNIKRAKIEREIIETESTYFYGISTLLNEILIPVFENKILDEKIYFKKITSSIPNLVAFHQLFLEQLTEAYKYSYDNDDENSIDNIGMMNSPIPEDNKYQSIAQVFNAQNKEEFISIYIKFISEYKTILDLFGTLHDNGKLQTFLREKRKDMKPLSNYLILPVQRVPRYVLLLKDLKKNTNKWYKDYSDIECALQLVEEIANEINERKRKIENLSQCLQIQQSLTNLTETIVDQKRRFDKQFVFIKKENKRQRMFFIFNDMIIITNKNWSVKDIISNIRTVEIKYENNDENRIFILIYGNNQCIYVAISIMEINEFKHIITQNRLKLMDEDIAQISGNKSVKEIREKIQKQRASNSNDFKVLQNKHLKIIYLMKGAYYDYKDAKGKPPSNVQLFLRYCKNKKHIKDARYSLCDKIIKEMLQNE